MPWPSRETPPIFRETIVINIYTFLNLKITNNWENFGAPVRRTKAVPGFRFGTLPSDPLTGGALVPCWGSASGPRDGIYLALHSLCNVSLPEILAIHLIHESLP